MPELAPPDLHRLRLHTRGDLVAALPVLIGFHPLASLVLISLSDATGGQVGLTVRLDLPPPGGAGDAMAAAMAVDAVLTDRPVGVAVVVVGPPHPLGILPAATLVELVAAGLGERGVGVDTMLWAAGTTAGEPWRCYGTCGCAGVVSDPGSSEAMAVSVAQGRVVAADRGELARRVAPRDAVALRRRAALLVERIESAAAGGDPPTDTDGVHAAMAVVDAAVAAAVARTLLLDDERVVALAMALADPVVRDAAMRHGLGADVTGVEERWAVEDLGAVEELWAALARETPDPEAATPAALLALTALLRGDGALAQVAAQRAEQAWPGHRLAGLVQGLLDARVRPSVLREQLADVASGRPVRGGRARG